MNLLMGVPLKATIATSNLMIGVTAATGAAIFYGRGYMDPYWAVPAALGILAGARLGPRLAIRLPTPGPRHRLRDRARRLRRADAPQGAGGRVSGERGRRDRGPVPGAPRAGGVDAPAPHVMDPSSAW